MANIKLKTLTVVSLLLSFAFILNYTTPIALAAEYWEERPQVVVDETTNEVISWRTEYSEAYMNEDGSITEYVHLDALQEQLSRNDSLKMKYDMCVDDYSKDVTGPYLMVGYDGSNDIFSYMYFRQMNLINYSVSSRNLTMFYLGTTGMYSYTIGGGINVGTITNTNGVLPWDIEINSVAESWTTSSVTSSNQPTYNDDSNSAVITHSVWVYDSSNNTVSYYYGQSLTNSQSLVGKLVFELLFMDDYQYGYRLSSDGSDPILLNDRGEDAVNEIKHMVFASLDYGSSGNVLRPTMVLTYTPNVHE